MKIYTRGGDKGETSLVYGIRVAKDDARVEAYGTCDEANSLIGLAMSHLAAVPFEGKEEFELVFRKVQTVLFHAGAELSTPTGKQVHWKLEQEHIDYLERVIDQWDSELPPLKNFILPGGHPSAAAFHTARTVVRRAERCAVAIGNEVSPLVLAYLNRLSDFLFVAARRVNLLLGHSEPILHGSE
ncbi:MAG: cob(I)yrinic acid a,c-diamide adenosyltransferase [Bacillus sp. (in: firmicutes)]